MSRPRRHSPCGRKGDSHVLRINQIWCLSPPISCHLQFPSAPRVQASSFPILSTGPLPRPTDWLQLVNQPQTEAGSRSGGVACVAASIAVGPSAILTGSRTRPSDRGWNGRFGPVEDRRNNHRLVTVACIVWSLQIWWLSRLRLVSPLRLRYSYRTPIETPRPA